MFNLISKNQNDEEIPVSSSFKSTDATTLDASLDDIPFPIDDLNEDKKILQNSFDEWKKQTTDKLNNEDEFEDNEKRLYIVSINDIPFYYHKDLAFARKKMWDLANKYILPDYNDDGEKINESRYLLTNNLNEIKVIIPFDFLIFTYSKVEYHLKLDYILPFDDVDHIKKS